MTLTKGSTARVIADELTTYSDKLNYPLARVPTGSIVTIVSGPNPYVYLTKGKGEMFYSVRWQGDRVAIAANNLRPNLHCEV